MVSTLYPSEPQTMGDMHAQTDQFLVGHYTANLFAEPRFNHNNECYGQFLKMMNIIGWDFFNIETADMLIKEISNRFPKGLAASSIERICLMILTKYKYEFDVIKLSWDVQAFFRHMFKKHYPYLAQAIDL